MSHLNRPALAVGATCLLASPTAASASSKHHLKRTGSSVSSARIVGPAHGTATSSRRRSPVAKRSMTVQIGATTGVIYLSRSETRQVGQGGAWVVAGAVGLALAPQTAGVGTIAAIAVGFALGSVGSTLIDSQLANGRCIKVSTPWLSFGTVAKVGWYDC